MGGTGELIAQSSSAVYNPLKDAFLYFYNKAKYVRDLEDSLTKLTAEMTTAYSRKKQIDRIMGTTVSREKNEEYHILVEQIEVVQKKYNRFISKYNKHCENLPSVASPEDASSASSVIDALQNRKPTILTRKFFKLAKLSKDINKLHDHISQVAERMKLENVVIEKEVQPVRVKYDDIDLQSYGDYVEKVLRYLHEDENRIVGIVGLIGVGKTTVMKKLNNRLKDTNLSLKLDVVIWINYSKQPDAEGKTIEMMQDVIMERLKLNEERTNSIEENADIISTALWDRKYILLIDQLSSTIDLNKVGISNDHKFGKIVVASSSRKVIRQMAYQQVEIRPLSRKEAFDLFQNVCGKITDARIKDTAERIIEACGGLPLVIKLVATYLKCEKDESVWINVKRMLQSETKSAESLKLGGVGNAYKLAYDKLDESHMKCLLFAALFPNDHKIHKNYLVECWNAESFLEDTPELRSARDCGATVLKELTDQYLLEWCSDNKYVKMPVYFRKVALEQRYPGEGNAAIWVPDKNKPVPTETWKTTKRMSLIRCKPKLPESPESHDISTLLLQWNPELVTLGDFFFRNMRNLRILDLNQTGIESLPTSISSLINLISLYLNDCSRLAKLPPEVKMLKKLEVLDIRRTLICGLPGEIGEMSQLRSLRISFVQKGCNRNNKGREVEPIIPRHVISNLQQLEELTIEMGCCYQGWNDISNKIVDELAQLEKLSSLRFNFPTICSLEKFVAEAKSWDTTDPKGNNFRSFKIFIGCCETRHPYASDISGILAERWLRFSTNSLDNEEISPVKEVLSQATAFELVGHSHVKSLSEFDLEKTGSLKVCVVERCKNLEKIVDDEKSDGAILQCLERLHLFELQLLQYIAKKSVSPGSFGSLKVLTLFCCPELTEILNHELAKALSSLKHVKVKDCPKVVEIVNLQTRKRHDISEHVDPSDILHKVKTIELVNLPELLRVCDASSIQWNSLRKFTVISCINLRNLCLTSNNAGMLETIRCEASWWEALPFPPEEKQHFLPSCDFVVQSLASVSSHVGESSSSRGRLVCEKGINGCSTGLPASGSDASSQSHGENCGDKIRGKAKLVSTSHQTSIFQAKVK